MRAGIERGDGWQLLGGPTPNSRKSEKQDEEKASTVTLDRRSKLNENRWRIKQDME
jgi:hypothetical protein